MNTKQRSATSTNRQPHFMKLSLMDNELSSMLIKLNSYRCEPCTSTMYDEYLKLHHDGLLLQQIIDKASKKVQDSINIPENIDSYMDRLKKKYSTFQKSFSAYFSEAKLHH